MSALAALAGAMVVGGLAALIVAVRGFDTTVPHRRWRVSRPRMDNAVGRLGLALIAGIVVAGATGWPVAAAAAGGLTLMLPHLLGSQLARRQRLARLEAVAGWAEMLRDTLSAGLGIETAIRASATAAPLAIRAEVQALASDLSGADLLDDALRRFAAQVDNPTCDRVVAALLLPRGSSSLGARLSAIAEAARADAEMRARIDAEREGTRWTARLIIAITALMALGLALLNRSYLAPYDSAGGQLVLLLVVAILGVGYIWLGRITVEPVPPRLLLGGKEGSR